MWLGISGACLLGNILAGKGVHAGDGVRDAGEGTIRLEQDF